MTASENPCVGAEVELEITDLAFGGRGVARQAGWVVFVEEALPGETVRARILRVRRGYAEARAVEVRRASSDRVLPACRHYGNCGGCGLQHLNERAQARAKSLQVASMLSRIGGLDDPPVDETVMAGEAWAYRSRMEFDCRGDETGRPVLGLHRRGDPAAMVSIEQCEIAPAAMNRVLIWLREAIVRRQVAPWDQGRRSGLLRRVGIREGRGTGEILVTLETGRGGSSMLTEMARELRGRFPGVVGVVGLDPGRRGPTVREMVLAGRGHFYEQIEPDRFKVPAQAFFQPNPVASAALRRVVIAALDPGEGTSVLELYSGIGFFTLALARRGARVSAVEGMAEASAAAQENLLAAGLSNCRFIHGGVTERLPRVLRRPWDAILLDPPRTGLPRGLARELIGCKVNRLVYVSCDPATLSRDLGILLAGGGPFRLASVTPVDLFPQTHHIECVARLDRR